MKLFASFATMMVASIQAASLLSAAEQHYGRARAYQP